MMEVQCTIDKVIAKAVRAHLGQDLNEDIRGLNLRPTITADSASGSYDGEFECVVCGAVINTSSAKERLRHDLHLLGRDKLPHVRRTWLGRVCWLCLEGGAKKAMVNLGEQIVTRCATRRAADAVYLHGDSIEDAAIFYKLIRKSLPRVAWWPTGQKLQRLDTQALR